MLNYVAKKSYERPSLEITTIVTNADIATLLSNMATEQTSIKQIQYNNIKY